MKFSIEGRMKNLRLPDGKTALSYSIYEAVTNGIQAIEERLKTKSSQDGRIAIRVIHKSKTAVDRVVIEDNGIGLNSTHLESFDTCDTLEKASIGGRGVGRLVWLKAFGRVDVHSTFINESGKAEQVRFEFRPRLDDSRYGLAYSASTPERIGTTVELSAPIAGESIVTMAALARGICHHFFHYFIAGSMPQTTIEMGKRKVDIGQYIRARMSVEKKETLSVPLDVGRLDIVHVNVDPRVAQKLSNSILLTAQGRVVETIEIATKFALKTLNGKRAYSCVVSGKFLDDSADQERTSFKASTEQIEAIKEAALKSAATFLEPHIQTIRVQQKAQVVNLLQEHPQLAVSVVNVDQYVEKLSPSMSDEEIAKTLFTLLYRRERGMKKQIAELETEGDERSAEMSSDAGDVPEISETVTSLLKKVSDDAKLRLAEYTIKRHQIIQIARSLLRYSDLQKRKYELEKAIHGYICPMGRMLTSKDYDDHNLWLIDDLLSYYQFFASDKSLTSLGVLGERKEPDLLFMNPVGFRREGTNDPVVIVEFKRPGDEEPSSDPIDQVLGYIEKLRSKTIRGPEGEIIGDISDTTPFECIVLCDLSAGARKRFERSVAQHPTPDGQGYYGFSPNHRASIRVVSYHKLFRDAELRNQSFFKHLGLLPEEVHRAIAKMMMAPLETA